MVLCMAGVCLWRLSPCVSLTHNASSSAAFHAAPESLCSFPEISHQFRLSTSSKKV